MYTTEYAVVLQTHRLKPYKLIGFSLFVYKTNVECYLARFSRVGDVMQHSQSNLETHPNPQQTFTCPGQE